MTKKAASKKVQEVPSTIIDDIPNGSTNDLPAVPSSENVSPPSKVASNLINLQKGKKRKLNESKNLPAIPRDNYLSENGDVYEEDTVVRMNDTTVDESSVDRSPSSFSFSSGKTGEAEMLVIFSALMNNELNPYVENSIKGAKAFPTKLRRLLSALHGSPVLGNFAHFADLKYRQLKTKLDPMFSKGLNLVTMEMDNGVETPKLTGNFNLDMDYPALKDRIATVMWKTKIYRDQQQKLAESSAIDEAEANQRVKNLMERSMNISAAVNAAKSAKNGKKGRAKELSSGRVAGVCLKGKRMEDVFYPGLSSSTPLDQLSQALSESELAVEEFTSPSKSSKKSIEKSDFNEFLKKDLEATTAFLNGKAIREEKVNEKELEILVLKATNMRLQNLLLKKKIKKSSTHNNKKISTNKNKKR